MDEKDAPFGHYEDLIAELDYKLQDLLSHIKLLSNKTFVAADYEITPQDINSISQTLYDKTISANIVARKLKASLNNLNLTKRCVRQQSRAQCQQSGLKCHRPPSKPYKAL